MLPGESQILLYEQKVCKHQHITQIISTFSHGGNWRLPCGWLMSLMKQELMRHMCRNWYCTLRSACDSSWRYCCWRSDSDIMRCVTEDGLSLVRTGDMIRPVEPLHGSGDGWGHCRIKWVTLTFESDIQVCKGLKRQVGQIYINKDLAW